ncbi:hypothetical protein OZ664_11735 [Elizabethkingia sp. HX WHF]|uniref:hypothetical protein n=1 Tax=Elizabethkingia TaxID=308865 RepID=UPI002A24C68C|nr:hypothetical protein [Elizabethkingia sp. HX WHF]MDX8564671.1 hypothetical protein [Elizabethkingia sp. HX WHF]
MDELKNISAKRILEHDYVLNIYFNGTLIPVADQRDYVENDIVATHIIQFNEHILDVYLIQNFVCKCCGHIKQKAIYKGKLYNKEKIDFPVKYPHHQKL